MEHRQHVAQFLPYLILLLCPLMHILLPALSQPLPLVLSPLKAAKWFSARFAKRGGGLAPFFNYA